MGDVAVINASPLIFLARGGHIDLLRHFARRLLIPEPVAMEILVRGVDDATVKAIKASKWMEVVPSPPVPDLIQGWGLGKGESSVLAIAMQNPGMEAIMDDLAGRRCAAVLNIPVRGTLGIILVAKQRGVISEVRPVMESLVREGMYLSRRIVDEILGLAGE